ncbi:MAG TPA: hypothetical protein VKU60_03625, partial [Chloroflexota bacterium]|nr:hypothetical protein [Chloroflexota bacterium]
RSVMAVEPSAPMRQALERNVAGNNLSNVSVIGDLWEDAAVEPANVVMAANVVIEVLHIEPFIKKMDESALDRCILVIRDTQEVEGFGRIQPGMALWFELWQKTWDEPPAIDPSAADLFNVLWQLGIRPDVQWFFTTSQAWADLDQPVDWVASQLYLPLSTSLRSEIRGLMDDVMIPHPNGKGFIRKVPPRTAVMSWTPLGKQQNP